MIVPMGYLVIIHVTDIDQARMVRSGVETAVDGAKVAGVYRYPDRSEEACPGFLGGCKEQSWTRHPRGYMVHACGRRRKGIRATVRGALFDHLGFNLLPKDHTPAAFANPVDPPAKLSKTPPSPPAKRGRARR
jgi:hypothetical protein